MTSMYKEHDNPCKKCKGILFYQSNNHCVKCTRSKTVHSTITKLGRQAGEERFNSAMQGVDYK